MLRRRPAVLDAIDDETDYFSSENNLWLPPQQREALKAKEEAIAQARDNARRSHRITLDLAGRRVVDSGDQHAHGTARSTWERQKRGL